MELNKPTENEECAWQGSCWSAVSSNDCKPNLGLPGGRGKMLGHLDTRTPIQLLHTRALRTCPLVWRVCAGLCTEWLLFPLLLLMAIILRFPQGSFNFSLGVIILISHWFYIENRKCFRLYLFKKKKKAFWFSTFLNIYLFSFPWAATAFRGKKKGVVGWLVGNIKLRD